MNITKLTTVLKIGAVGLAIGLAVTAGGFRAGVSRAAGPVQDPPVQQQEPLVEPAPIESNIVDAPHIYYGVGLSWSYVNGEPAINALVEGGPAEQAGIRVGDVLVRVDGQDAASLDLIETVRGEKGTPVTLTIRQADTGREVDVAVVRDEINLAKVAWSCAAQPIRGFGKVWQERSETHQLLGCPFTNFRRDEHATRAAVQTFERGWMLWLETDTVANVDPIYVFFADDSSYTRYGDRPLADAHSYAPTEPGFYKVGDRFARVYWEEIGEQGRQRLGRATNEARDSLGAFQEFERGRMFWAGEADTIYVIYQGDYDFDGDGQVTWQQGWLSYEDTFEASEEQ